MLGQPEPVEAPALGMLGEIQAVVQRLGSWLAE